MDTETPKMTCMQVQPWLTAYLLDDLTPESVAEIRRHVENCEACRAAANDIEPTLDLLRDALAASSKAAGRLSDSRRARVLREGGGVCSNKRKGSWITRPHPVLSRAATVVVCLGIVALLGILSMPAFLQYRCDSAAAIEQNALRIQYHDAMVQAELGEAMREESLSRSSPGSRPSAAPALPPPPPSAAPAGSERLFKASEKDHGQLDAVEAVRSPVVMRGGGESVPASVTERRREARSKEREGPPASVEHEETPGPGSGGGAIVAKGGGRPVAKGAENGLTGGDDTVRWSELKEANAELRRTSQELKAAVDKRMESQGKDLDGDGLLEAQLRKNYDPKEPSPGDIRRMEEAQKELKTEINGMKGEIRKLREISVDESVKGKPVSPEERWAKAKLYYEDAERSIAKNDFNEAERKARSALIAGNPNAGSLLGEIRRRRDMPIAATSREVQPDQAKSPPTAPTDMVTRSIEIETRFGEVSRKTQEELFDSVPDVAGEAKRLVSAGKDDEKSAGKEAKSKGAMSEAEVWKRLETVKIPDMEFRQANIQDVARFYEAAARDFSPSGEGASKAKDELKIVVPGGQAAPAAVPAADASDPFAPVDRFGGSPAGADGSPSDTPLLTFSARDISLAEALKITAQITGSKLRIEDGKVVLAPLNFPDGDIVHRVYEVSGDFAAVLGDIHGGKEFASELKGEPDGAKQSDEIDLAPHFGKLGVRFPDGSGIRFDRRIGKLIAVNTANNIVQIEEVANSLRLIKRPKDAGKVEGSVITNEGVLEVLDLPDAHRERLRKTLGDPALLRSLLSRAGVDAEADAKCVKYLPSLDKLLVVASPAVVQQIGKALAAKGEEAVDPRFKAVGVNPFIETLVNAFSTFGIDVDTAAYTLARSYMQRGFLPPAESVRTEEFVNAFDYAYRPPQRGLFDIHVEGAPSKFGHGLSLLKIGVKGKRLGREEQRQAVLTFVIDTSGSMNQPDRIGLIKKSLRLLVEKLNPKDLVAIVQYGSQARLILEHTAASEKGRILEAIDGMECDGSTNLEAGMAKAYEVAARDFVSKGENRVMLMSDGVANLGAESAADILKKVERYRRQGILCSVVGVGTGTYDDTMLEALANKGDGTYRFIDSEDEARRVFVDDLSATLNTIAKDVKIQVEFNPSLVAKYRQLGYENRQLKKEQFRDDTVDAGEVGSGQSVTALYELDVAEPGRARMDRAAGTAMGEDVLAIVRVRYLDLASGKVEEIEQPVRERAVHSLFDAAGPRFRLAACVAEFAEILRGSPFAEGSTFADLARVIRPVALELNLDKRVQELAQLIEGAEGMTRGE